MNTRRGFGTRRLPAVGVICIVWLLLAAPSARAHPWGAPPTAEVSVGGTAVTIDWRAEADDTIALAASLGLVDPTRIDWTWRGADELEPGLVSGEALEEAHALHGYVLDHIRVLQDGAACAGAVQTLGAFTTEGIRVVYECPAPVSEVRIRITMLHDLHEAYRTFAEAGGDARPARQVFTVTRPEHRWHLGAGSKAAAGLGRADSWLPPLGGLGVAAALLVAALTQRRHRLVGRAGGTQPVDIHVKNCSDCSAVGVRG